MRTLVTQLADLRPVRFSNRPFRVKRFQTIHPTVSMSLTGSCFSSESAPRPLYGIFLVKKFKHGGASFFHRYFFADLKVRFFSSRTGFVRASLVRPHIDGLEHNGTFMRSG